VDADNNKSVAAVLIVLLRFDDVPDLVQNLGRVREMMSDLEE